MPNPLAPAPAVPVTAVVSRPQASAPGRPRAGVPDDSALKKACNEMEAYFINHLLSEMRKTIEKSGLIDGGRSEEIYTSLMDAELAKDMARSGALGLSRMLHENLVDGPGRNGAPVPRK